MRVREHARACTRSPASARPHPGLDSTILFLVAGTLGRHKSVNMYTNDGEIPLFCFWADNLLFDPLWDDCFLQRGY